MMKTILIYDPDPDLLEIMCLALEMEDFQTVALQHFNADLIRLIDDNEPDLVLLDFAYSGDCCINWCRLIKCVYPNMPVLAVSCNNNIQQIYNGHGFDDCISKPFSLADLYTTVGKYICSLTSRHAELCRHMVSIDLGSLM